MAIQTSGTLKIEASWLQKDTGAGTNNTQDSVVISKTNLFADGTGSGQINTVWYGAGTLNNTETDVIDLYSLEREIFGGTFETTFSGGEVKAMFVENTSTGTGQVVALVNSPTNHFKHYSAGAGCTLLVSPETILPLVGPGLGYEVNSSNRYLTLSGQASGCTYEIGIIGSV